MSASGKVKLVKEKVSGKNAVFREARSQSVNKLEQRTALREVQGLHKFLKMPVPQMPAVLAYLRWLDKMESWIGDRHSSSVVDPSRRQNSMFSWSGNFGNPIALPKIKKHKDPEKYRSRQFKESLFKNDLSHTSEKPILTRSYSAKNPPKSLKIGESEKTLFRYYKPDTMEAKNLYKTKPANQMRDEARYNHKPTGFYIHAKEGFEYWPKELYKPPEHPTKYSFGERFNPGRAGVITDRIYAKPRTNKHYWTEFQTRQNPIGSGNTVTGAMLRN